MSRRVAVALALIAASLLIAATGWRVVRPGERIVVRRFGRIVVPDWGPGLHWGAPLGIDRFDRVRTDEVRRLNVGVAPDAAADGDPGADEFLTGDLNLVRVRAVIQYRVASPAVLVVRCRRCRGPARPAGRGQPLALAGAAGDRRCAERRPAAHRRRGRTGPRGRRSPGLAWAWRSWA